MYVCMYERLAYPCRYHDLIHRIGRPVPEPCTISNTVLNWIYENHSHRLTSWNNQPFLSPANLQLYAQAILGVPAGKCQRGEFVYLLGNVPIQLFFHYFKDLKWISL